MVFFVGTVICFPGKIYLLSQNLMLLFSLAKFGDFPGFSVENAKTAAVSDKSSNFPPHRFFTNGFPVSLLLVKNIGTARAAASESRRRLRPDR